MTASSITPDRPFDPFDERHTPDAVQRLAVARSSCPVSEPRPGIFVVARHADVEASLRDPGVFSSRGNFSLDDEPFGGTDMPQAITALDPPAHTELRTRLRVWFSPGRLRGLESTVRGIVTDVLDGFAAGESLDVVARISRVVPVRVVYAFIGLPEQDWERVQAWQDAMGELLPRLPPDLPEFRSMLGYVADLVADRAARPPTGADVLDGLVHPALGRPGLSVAEIQAHVLQLIMAGTDTTGALIANLVHQLLAPRSHWEWLLADRALVPVAIEESLRRDTPLQYTLRTAAADTQIAGCPVPRGSRVVLSLQSANQDEAAWGADVAEFDPERGRNGQRRHLAFGYGIHLCLGAPLARLEARVVVEELLERFPATVLAPGFERRDIPGGFLRSPQRLDVVL